MRRIDPSDRQVYLQPEMNLTSATAEAFREELLHLVSRNNAELVIDLEKVQRIDSVGLGVFIATFNALKKNEKKLKVINASRKILSLFRTMGLTRRFAVHGKDS